MAGLQRLLPLQVAEGDPADGTGSQNVTARNSSTALTAVAPASPVAVSPAVSAASTAPSPPGVGTAEPSALPVRKTTAALVIAMEPPKAGTQAVRQST